MGSYMNWVVYEGLQTSEAGRDGGKAMGYNHKDCIAM